MARQRDLFVGIVSTRHWPHGAIGGRQRLCLGHGIQKRLGRRKFIAPIIFVAFPIHGQRRMRRGKQGDDGEYLHGPSMNLLDSDLKSKADPKPQMNRQFRIDSSDSD